MEHPTTIESHIEPPYQEAILAVPRISHDSQKKTLI